MLNPLSVQRGQHVSGKEINDWCRDQIETNGSHVKDAKRLLAKNYRDDVMYRLSWKAETSGSPMGHTIEFDRVNKHTKRKQICKNCVSWFVDNGVCRNPVSPYAYDETGECDTCNLFSDKDCKSCSVLVEGRHDQM